MTNDNVVFRVGKDVDSMRRVLFPEGLAVELNNQSKHAVINLGEKERIHLIFDFVESDDLIPPLVALKVVFQHF